MAVFKRGKYYYIRFKFKGKEIYRSTGTSTKQKALELEAKVKKELWDRYHLNKSPTRYWIEAVTRYLDESTKKTINDDVVINNWVEPFLKDKALMEVTKEVIEEIKEAKIKEGSAAATVNHVLRFLGTVLRKSHAWGWLDSVPHIEKLTLNNKRVRWLTIQEANKLLSYLPEHLKAMAAFTLSTGLRASNVRLLKWSQINIERRHAFIEGSDTKNAKALAVPLNSDAIAILKQQTKNSEYVFVYKGKPVGECNTKAWRKALIRAKIKDFRWHDLRHTWASWHIQNGTTLQELQALGGWSDFNMVLRYAHLSSDHLQAAADRITGAKMVHKELKVVNE